jgi:hypothetical protein
MEFLVALFYLSLGLATRRPRQTAWPRVEPETFPLPDWHEPNRGQRRPQHSTCVEGGFKKIAEESE